MGDIKDVITDVYKDFYGVDKEVDDVIRRKMEEMAGDAAKVNDLLSRLEQQNLLKTTQELVSSLPGLEGTGRSEEPGPGKNTDKKPDGENTAAQENKGAEADKAEAEKAEAEKADAGKKAVKEEKSGMEELNELIGLDKLKEDVTELVNLMKAQKMREEHGLKTVPVSKHLVFTGNPGTGKTTVARILAKLYREIGVLSKGQLIEVDRSGLVAGYIGQTALKTQEKIQEALGGILFIDEAYALAKDGNDFGQEAIDTILKAMEDNRDDFVVIVAGYTVPMEAFINSNPGLKSRFNKYFFFEDYTVEELIGIFGLQCRKYDYVLSADAEKLIRDKIGEMVENKGENFANAREVRNLFETIITDQATRLAAMESPSAEDLKTILPEDVLRDGMQADSGKREETSEDHDGNGAQKEKPSADPAENSMEKVDEQPENV